MRRAAENASPAVAEWAEAVEHAAFDQGVVDARVEAEVNELDPDRLPNSRRPPPPDRRPPR